MKKHMKISTKVIIIAVIAFVLLIVILFVIFTGRMCCWDDGRRPIAKLCTQITNYEEHGQIKSVQDGCGKGYVQTWARKGNQTGELLPGQICCIKQAAATPTT